MPRTFPLAEHTAELHARCEAYAAAKGSARYQAGRRVLAAAHNFGMASRSHRAKNPPLRAQLATRDLEIQLQASRLRRQVQICPGCKKVVPPNRMGRPRKYHDAVCRRIARSRSSRP